MNSIDRNIVRIAVPSIVSNVTVPLLGLCDVTIMGHVGGAAHIGAIAVGSMVFNVMYWLFVFLRMGTSGRTAQARGARRLDQCASHLMRGLRVALAFSSAIVLFQLPLRLVAFYLLQATPDVEALATPYYYICVWGAPAVLCQYVLAGWFIGMQNTRTPMAVAILQNVINISASLLLVVGFGLGVRGVALGTLIAQWAALLLSLWLLRRYYGKMLRRHWEDFRFSIFDFRFVSLLPGWHNQRHIRNTKPEGNLQSSIFNPQSSSVDRDIFLRTVCLVAVNLYFTSAGAAQGAEILAANALLMQFFMVFSYVMDGFANAGEALAGRYYGAGDGTRLRQTIGHLFAWGASAATLFTAVYAVGGTGVLILLTSDASVVATATRYLPWAVLVPAAGMAAFVWDGIFIGLTLSRGMLIACLVAAVAFFAIYLALSSLWGNHALWLSLIAYLALRGITQTIIMAKKQSASFAKPSPPLAK